MKATILRAGTVSFVALALAGCGADESGDDASSGANVAAPQAPAAPVAMPGAAPAAPATLGSPTPLPIEPVTPGDMPSAAVPGAGMPDAVRGAVPDPVAPSAMEPVATEPTPVEPPTPVAEEPVPVDTPQVEEPVAEPVANPPVELGTALGVSSTLLVSGAEPASGNGFGSDLFAVTPLAVDPSGERVYVGYNDSSAPEVGLIAGSDGSVIQIQDAVVGGVAVTSDGVAALLFDPNSNVDERMWAAVERFDANGASLFRTELFHSPNLDDEGTKGAPSTSRFGYLAGSDTLVAYFGHTQRYSDGVRHQGGYLALVDAAGEQDVLNEWFGSHNLDQRLLVDATDAYVLGLGDAYPEGIFFGATSAGGRMDPRVLAPLASAGNGATNGQLGGLVDLGSEIVVPFITNRSVPPDLDAGTWPDIDDAIADQIRDAASNGTDLGWVRVAKDALPDGDTSLEVTWLDPGLTEGSSLVRLKAAPFGAGNVLLAWAEESGSGRDSNLAYFTQVLGSDASVVQPKAPLDSAYAFSGGDDIVPRGSVGVLWASVQSDGIHVVSMNAE